MTEVSYTKLFSSITASTIWCESAETRIVWITMLAMSDNNGWVYASVPGLANMAQISVEKTEIALEKFLSPDKYSRTPDNEGRRIEAIDGGWSLLNHPKYRALRSADERREYQRNWIAEKRRAEKESLNVDKSVDKVYSSLTQSTHTDTDTDTVLQKKKVFSKPTLEEIKIYIKNHQYSVNPESFFHHYESNGWKVGRNPMKSWQSAISSWQAKEKSNGTHQKSNPKPETNLERLSKRLQADLADP